MAETMPNAICLSKKRVQSCSSCKNHGTNVSKTGHRCPYKTCICILCRLLKQSQKVMCHQQRFWRHQKLKLDNEIGNTNGSECEKCIIENRESRKKKHQKCDDQDCFCENCNRRQVCDKCRNHNLLVPKKNHKCPHKTCKCEYCELTFKRRKIMKHLQRVKRSDVTNSIDPIVTEAENLFRQNQSEISFISDSSTPEDEVDDCDQSDSNQEDDVEPPKRQSSLPQKVSKNIKKQRLLGARVTYSPPATQNFPPMQDEQPQTPRDMPALEPYDNISVSSPPMLIDITKSDSHDEISPVEPTIQRPNILQEQIYNNYPSVPQSFNGLYKDSSPFIAQQTMRYQNINPDISSISSETSFVYPRNLRLPDYLPFSQRIPPLNPSQFCFPRSSVFYQQTMRRHNPHLNQLSLRHGVEKMVNLHHPTAINPTHNIYHY